MPPPSGPDTSPFVELGDLAMSRPRQRGSLQRESDSEDSEMDRMYSQQLGRNTFRSAMPPPTTSIMTDGQ